ncbi:MAG TPA: hypothetical protein DCL15_16615 [Chloroflexi bacterium]|nr:hypothetical protein [Chloroflexota bacterium]HHW89183.1 hypothetical protein [Chloroflexota bacterium]
MKHIGKHIGMIGLGLWLVLMLFGVTIANVASGAPLAQRATSTPSPTAALRITPGVRQLPILAPVTATVAVSATPTVTAVSSLTATPGLTLPVRTTPTPVLRTTPTVVPPAADAPDGIVNFTAIAARLRGQIELRWEYVGAPFVGVFTVERSANGGAWRYVANCTQPYAADESIYRCRDVGLTSGAAYQYRVCITESGYSCAGAVIGETDPIRSP